MTAPLTNDTVLWLAVIAGVTLVALVGRVASIFRPDEIDEDDLADRIETAIGDATRDLLDALAQIERDTTVIADACHEQLERDREYREDDTDEDQGAALHGMFLDPRYGRPRGFRPAETTPPYEFVDLRKPE